MTDIPIGVWYKLDAVLEADAAEVGWLLTAASFPLAAELNRDPRPLLYVIPAETNSF